MPAQPVLPPSWLHVLEKIEDSLAETVRRVAEREEALSAPPADTAGRDAEWQKALAKLDDRLAALDDCAGRAGRAATAADTALADGADELDRWLTAARKLAGGAGGAVS